MSSSCHGRRYFRPFKLTMANLRRVGRSSAFVVVRQRVGVSDVPDLRVYPSSPKSMRAPEMDSLSFITFFLPVERVASVGWCLSILKPITMVSAEYDMMSAVLSTIVCRSLSMPSPGAGDYYNSTIKCTELFRQNPLIILSANFSVGKGIRLIMIRS